MRVALFDFDGTLLDVQSYRFLLETARDLQFRPSRLRALLIKRLPGQWLKRTGLVNRLDNQRRWAEGLAWYLAGATVAEAVELFRAAMARLEPHLRPELLEEMMARRREGYQIVLASTVADRFLSQAAEMLMAEAFVGTPLAVVGEQYAGTLAGPVCQGEEKVNAANALAADWGMEIDWANSYAYSDGWPDLPMLQQAGHPVAVYPDAKLRQQAVASGWRVIG